MADLERDVRSLLRPSEYLLVILEGSSLQHGRSPLAPHPKASPPTSSDDKSLASSGPFEGLRIVLAIVGHDDRTMGESGRLTHPTFFLCHLALNCLLKCVPLLRGDSTNRYSWTLSLAPSPTSNPWRLFSRDISTR